MPQPSRKTVARSGPEIIAPAANNRLFRDSGIPAVGRIKWGTHFCQFYETKTDLLETLIQYFEAGLKNNEFCVLVTSEFLTAEVAKAAMRKKISGFSGYLKKGQIEIFPHTEWYLKGGKFEMKRVLADWIAKYKYGMNSGFSGVRISGNPFWLESKQDWEDFTAYEAEINNVIGGYKMIVLCTYALDKCGANEVVDVVSNHEFALIKRKGRWESIESAAHKKIESALRESEVRYHSLFDEINESLVLCDLVLDAEGKPADYRFIDVNRAYERITGLKRNDVVGKSRSEVLPRQNTYSLSMYGEAVLTGKPVTFETYSESFGKYLQIHAYRTAPLQFAALFIDITEQKKSEEALRESEEKYKNLVKYAPVAIYEMDVSGSKFFSVNDVMCDILGYTSDELLSMKPIDLMDEKSAALFKERIVKRTAGERIEEAVEYRVKRKDGKWICAAISVGSLAYTNDMPSRVTAIAHDITIRKMAEEERERLMVELKERAAELDAVFSVLPYLVSVHGMDGRYLRVNPAMINLFGFDPTAATREQIARAVNAHFADGSRLNSENMPSSRALRGEAVFNKEYIITDAQGRERMLLINAVPLKVEGRIRGAVLAQMDITERKKIEDELRETRDYLDNLLNYANAPIIVWDSDYRITKFNHAFERLTGRISGEVTSQHLEILFPDVSREESMRHIREAVAGEHWETVEIPILHKDGSVRTVLWNSANIHGADKKKIVATIAQGHDITGRKQADEQLIKFNRTLKALSDSNQAMMRAEKEADYLREVCRIIIEDCGHAMVWIGLAENDGNKSVKPVAYAGFEKGYLDTLNVTWADAERGWGPTGSAIRTRKTVACANMLTDPKFAPWRQEAIKRGYASSISLPLLREEEAFGAITIYSRQSDAFSPDEIKLLEELAGDLAYGIYLLRLKVANEKAKEALKLSEEKFRFIADTMPNLVWTASASGSIDYANKIFEDYAGIPAQVGTRWIFDYIYGDDRKKTAAVLDDASRRGEAFQIEHRIKRRDGQFRWFLTRGIPVKNKEEKIVKWYGTATDIHDIKRAQEHMKRVDEEKNHFISMMSHELRNPLTPIMAGIELIRAELSKKPVSYAINPIIDESARIIEQQSRNMARLMDDLLDISRIGRGKIALKKQTIRLNDSLERAMKAVQPLVKAQKHRLLASMPDHALYVEADPVRLEQIIINLLNNAAKYMKPGGHIWIKARRDGDMAEISVRDKGIGIDPEKITMLFDSFSGGYAPYVSTQGELGIGLKLTKDLIALHGGTIKARSEGKNQGCEFIVRLPALPASFAVPAQAPVVAAEPLQKRKRIVIVDDNAQIAQLIGRTLDYFGHETRVCLDGMTAIALVKKFRAEIVLIDIGLLGMDGYELARRLRSQENGAGQRIRLVAVTGYGQDEDRQRSFAAGFDMHLVKPVDMNTLKKAITDLS